MNRLLLTRLACASRSISSKDYTLPTLDTVDVQETHVRGSGPGGMNVNKARNKVVLKHMPTGVVVYSHDDRKLETNRRIAMRRLQLKV